MKYFYTEVDSNDADYVGNFVKVSDEELERFRSLIEKIRNFEPYETKYGTLCSCNFPYGECKCNCEKDPCELYDIDDETMCDFVDVFGLDGGEWGFHTITKIQEVTLGKE